MIITANQFLMLWKSTSTTDDKKIMESVLSGSDTFNLSNQDDKVMDLQVMIYLMLDMEMILLMVDPEQTL